MSNHNPFLQDQNPQPHFPQPTPASGSRKILIVIAVVGLVGMCVCCGFGTLAYFTLESSMGGSPMVDLELRSDKFADGEQTFNSSLNSLASDPCTNSKLCDFVKRSVTAIEDGDSIAFSRSMFTEAVKASRLSGGSLPFDVKMTLFASLNAYEPAPDPEIDFYRILNVREEPAGILAEVALLFYTSHSQVESHQWFLVLEQREWKLYDWQRMEYGRRMSDEYAGYLRGSDHLSPGYDDAMNRLVKANDQWYEGNRAEAKRLIHIAENRAMLNEDKSIALMRCAYMWMSFGEDEQAIRVFESIDDPDTLWGVWPSLSVCHYNLQQYDEALVSVQRAQQQSPSHPNVLSVASQIHEATGQTELAAAEAVAALRICPEDQSYFSSVIDFKRLGDIPDLIDAAVARGEREFWSQIFYQAKNSRDWASDLLEIAKSRDDMPDGIADLAEASAAWSNGDFDSAARHYVNAKKTADQDFLIALATSEHLSTRLKEDKFDELFDEIDEIDDVLVTLIEWAYDDDLYCDNDKLIDSLGRLQSGSKSPWIPGLNGWAHYMNDDYEAAQPHFEKFLTWLNDPEQIDDDDNAWIADSTEYYLTDTMLELGLIGPALQRWSDDRDRHQQIGNYLIANHSATANKTFLSITKDTPSKSLQLQRFRLQASMFKGRGSGTSCDRFHRQAIDIARNLYDEEQSYQINGLVSQRAKDLVWHRIEPDNSQISFDDELDQSHRRQYLTTAISESALLCDADLLNRWIKLADTRSDEDKATYAEMMFKAGEFWQSQGKIDEALDALQKSVQHTQDDQGWVLRGRQQGLLSALLEASKYKEARAVCIDLATGEDTVIGADAIVDVVSGQFTKVAKQLADAEDEALAEFLGDYRYRSFFAPHANADWMQELRARAPVEVRYMGTAVTGELLMSASETIDKTMIAGQLKTIFATDFTVDPLSLSPSPERATGWIATSGDGRKLAFRLSKQQFQTEGLPGPIADRLQNAVSVLEMEVLDDKPKGTQRLFQIASQLSSPSSIAFTWGQTGLVWTTENLNRKLTWQDRVPTDTLMRPIRLVRKLRDQDESDDRLEINDWKQRLDEADGSLEVYLTLYTSTCSERTKATLVQVNVDEYRVIVKPRTSSNLDPFIQAGTNCSCHASEITPIPVGE